MSVGENIRIERKRAGLTQKELAERLGISAVGVAQWENGLRNPKFETLKKIADALGTNVESLLDEFMLAQIEHNTHKALVDAMENVSNSAKKLTDSGIPEDEVTRVMEQLKGLVDFALEETDLQELIHLYQSLNCNGQRVALERLEELAQLPKYQRHPSPNAPQEPPSVSPDKDPEQE